jgi:hypothetical protein
MLLLSCSSSWALRGASVKRVLPMLMLLMLMLL